MAEVFVSVIIPVYNAQKTLEECLQSIRKSSYEHFEIIVVDDHSSDGSSAIARCYSHLVVELEQRQGAAAARNVGASRARGSILMFVDADVVISPDTVRKIVDSFNNSTAAAVGMYDDSRDFKNFSSVFKNLWLYYMFLRSPVQMDWFWTGCGAVRTEVFQALRGFNENLKECEDYALGYLISLEGKRIYLNKAIKVTHRHERTFWHVLKNDFRRSCYNILIIEKLRKSRDKSFATGGNLLRVALAGTILLLGCIAFTNHLFGVLLVLAVALYLVANLDFFSFLISKCGLLFLVKAIGLTYLTHLNMGFGGAAGFLLALFSK